MLSSPVAASSIADGSIEYVCSSVKETPNRSTPERKNGREKRSVDW
jgi:hypothetical protein